MRKTEDKKDTKIVRQKWNPNPNRNNKSMEKIPNQWNKMMMSTGQLFILTKSA